MREVKLTPTKPDIEIQHSSSSQILCHVWRADASTLRITMLVGNRCRVFDVSDLRGICERHD